MSEPEPPNDLREAQEIIGELRQVNAQQAVRIEQMERQVEDLKGKLEEALRSGKRQAGPFSKGAPKANPKKPGQKVGHVGVHRDKPTQIDRTVKAELPAECECGGAIVEDEVRQQYQVDIPRPIPTIVTQFDVSVGHCETCGRRHQGRHDEQTSDALGAAGVQIGPNVMAWGAELKHGFGISYGKIAQLLSSACGLRVNRSSLVRGDERIAGQLVATYEQLILRLRESTVVYGDETSWRINGGKAWLWVFTNDDAAVYTIDPTRAHQVVERILGTDFKGILKCDCFLAYDDADLAAIEQSKCLGHLLRRCSDVGENTTGRAVVFSRQVAKLLRAAIALKERRDTLSPHGYLVARGRLEAGLDRLLQGTYSDPENAKLAKLLRKHRHQLFGFLAIPELDATNNAAERDIRPAVIVRKTNGCNRSPVGARTHEIITSVFRTCAKQGKDFVAHVADLLRNPNTPPLTIFPPIPAAPAPS